MIHGMSLQPEPFEMMARGLKTIELRLLDEKRQKIQVGDTLIFINAARSACKIFCRVVKLHKFDNFAQLYASLPLEKCGYRPMELAAADPKDMEAYYSPEEQARYGVVGIELQVTEVLL